MTVQLLLAFVLFAFATAGTPGPNNMMLLASGANFGFRATILHILGISVGLGVMVAAMGLGLGGVFKAWPVLHDVLRWVGGAYLLWLAWKIATAKGISDKDAAARPMTFLGAAAFQWVNPKAWAMALTAVTTYTPEGSALAVFIVAGTFMLVGAPCSAAWAGFGQGMRRFLDRPPVLRAFNLTMAALLVASLYPLVVETGPKKVEAPRQLAVQDMPPPPRIGSHG
ncbi:lysine transporter LysE [Caulobacter sp. Root655]|uniref:LysE family translocator n=1 Tax=Caulobacter sp. Root655 TaxID=1736578 RepID=UPI0006F82C33|nr:LysE family translocator [Caulobacter sp. Root655]KRA64721.1 lysine transporter LysE [Caulobacter sp. Root655]